MNQEAPEQIDPGSMKKRPTRQRRLWLRVLLVLLVLSVALTALLPTLVSTSVGTRLVLGAVNRRIAGSVDVRKLMVAWLGPQKIAGLRVRDSENAQVLTAEQIDLPETSLFSVMGSRFGKMKVTNLVASVDRYEDGTTNVQRVLAAPVTPAEEKAGAGAGQFSLSVKVVDAEVTYKGPDLSPIVTTIPTAVFDLTDMRRIRLSLKSSVAQADLAGKVELEAKIQDLFDAQGLTTIDRAQITVQVLLEDVPVAALDALAKQDGLLVSLLGPRVNGSLDVNGQLSNLQAKLDATAQNFKARVTVRGDEQKLAVDAHESPIELTVTPTAWTHLSKRYAVLAGTTLTTPFPVHLVLKKASVSLDAQRRPLLQQAELNAELTVGNFLLDSAERVGTLGLHETRFDLTTESLGKAVALVGSTVAIQKDHRGRLGLNVALENLLDQSGQFNSKGLSSTMQVEFADLPVAVVEQFAPGGSGLTEVLGSTVTARLNGRLKLDEGAVGVSGPITLTAQSQHMTAELNMALRPDGSIAQQSGRPLFMDLVITPAGFDRIIGKLAAARSMQLELTQPSRVRLKADGTVLAWQSVAQRPSGNALPIDLNRSRIVATLTADTKSLRFGQADALSGKFKAVRIKLNAEKPADAVQVDVQADLVQRAADTPAEAEPALRFSGRISRLVDAQGTISPKSTAVSSITHVNRFPVALLDAVFRREGQLLALLGQVASFTLEAQRVFDGPASVKLSLESENTRATAAGVVDDQWRLALSEDLKAFLKVTPAMGDVFLAALNPLLADVHSAEKPIELTIRKEGFDVPLSDLRLANTKLNGTLDMGTLRIRQTGITGALVRGLRMAGSRIQDRPQFEAKFSMLEFKVADGVITSNDLWMDSGDLLLASQARVHQAGDDDLRADMLMAVPGETLRLIPRLTKRIRPEALYELHVHGPLSKLEPDFGAFLLPIITEAMLGEAGGGIRQLIVGIGQSIGENKTRGTERSDAVWRNARWDNRPTVDRLRWTTEAAAPPQRSEPEPSVPDAIDLLGELLRRSKKKQGK